MSDLELFFGYQDIIILAIVIISNYWKWSTFPKFQGCLSWLLILFLYGVLLPMISIFIEVRMKSEPGDEAINFLYAYFRFPVYWFIGLIQLGVVFYKKRVNKQY